MSEMKKLVVVEQGKYVDHELTINKHAMLSDANIDVLRFNYLTEDDSRAQLTIADTDGVPIHWGAGRDLLVSHVIDKYEYIMYTDEDIHLQSFGEGINPNYNPWKLLVEFLDEWNPIGGNVQTVAHAGHDIWCRDDRVLQKIGTGEPCIIKRHDQCNMILRNDVCKLFHPVRYGGGHDGSTIYQQFVCHKLREEYFLSPPNIVAINGFEEAHFHHEMRHKCWDLVDRFREDLKDPVMIDDHLQWAPDQSVTTDYLANKSALKNAPPMRAEEYNSLFKDS